MSALVLTLAFGLVVAGMFGHGSRMRPACSFPQR